MSYRFADRLRAGSGLCVQWKTADDGQRNCPKHVEIYSKNKFDKLVYLVGFILRIAIELSLDGSSPYTSTDKTNNNKYT